VLGLDLLVQGGGLRLEGGDLGAEFCGLGLEAGGLGAGALTAALRQDDEEAQDAEEQEQVQAQQEIGHGHILAFDGASAAVTTTIRRK
jgi:hypothetical protein